VNNTFPHLSAEYDVQMNSESRRHAKEIAVHLPSERLPDLANRRSSIVQSGLDHAPDWFGLLWTPNLPGKSLLTSHRRRNPRIVDTVRDDAPVFSAEDELRAMMRNLDIMPPRSRLSRWPVHHVQMVDVNNGRGMNY
jgi:hypothetical protein